MFDEMVLVASTPFEVGDRILVLFGDTPIQGTIDGACHVAGGDGPAWNVRTDASVRAYPIHEEFLRRAPPVTN